MKLLAEHHLTETQTFAVLNRTSAAARPRADLPHDEETEHVIDVLVRLDLLRHTQEGLILTSTGEVILDALWLTHSTPATRLRDRVRCVLKTIAPASPAKLARVLGERAQDVERQLQLLCSEGVVAHDAAQGTFTPAA
ncbi:hypothetical protein [Deinococcus pimensis]|uniref:hypothetical protein n=1 Tax=Deinococcus pimensis TaxID=309888 RepID=UPI000486EF7A|nr:hypothetical protein [Deinococcus pimensis]